MNQWRDDLDGPWKLGIELHFKSLIHICFPQVYDRIDWQKPIQFLDQELNQVIRQAKTGRQRVDKLVSVYLKEGQKAALYIHLEIQNHRTAEFAVRIYKYHARLHDRLGVPVVTLVVLGDKSANCGQILTRKI